jgi:ATP-dependent RNA helicase DeaD
MRRGTLQMGSVRIVVLDEADEMLDMGFQEDIEAVLKESPAGRQTVLFSATMPPRIESIAKRHQRDPIRIRINKPAAKAGEAPKVRQQAYLLPRSQKMAALGRILDLESPAARSSSAARASRWTSWPRRSTRAATSPRRSTAA